MPGDKIFIDSNTFLYSIQIGLAEKREKARHWLVILTETNLGVTNLQVLNEITNVLFKKPGRFDVLSVFRQVDTFSDFGSAPLAVHDVLRARNVRERYAYSWWDCLLIASALELGCRHFLSEDLQDGQVIEGLTIVDPFAHSPEQILRFR